MAHEPLSVPSRRTVARTAVWTVPVVSLAAAVPAASASPTPGMVYGDCPTLCVGSLSLYPRLRIYNGCSSQIYVTVGFSVVYVGGAWKQVTASNTGAFASWVGPGQAHTFTDVFVSVSSQTVLPGIGDSVDVQVRYNLYYADCVANGYHSDATKGFVFAC